MAPQIKTLIVGKDNTEVVLNQIAAILTLESTGQQALARVSPTADVNDYILRVFLERAAPWGAFDDSPNASRLTNTPVINVTFASSSYDMSRSMSVGQQMCIGIFNIDCYAYQCATRASDGSWTPGDENASAEALRAARMCRNILMAGIYTYLGMQGIVARRYVQGFTLFQPAQDYHAVVNITAARLALQVEYLECAPQVQGVPLQSLALQVTRASDGQLIAESDTSFT